MLYLKRVIALFLILCLHFLARSQVDSLARNLVDTIKAKLIVDEIPRRTLFDKAMYPHRWYVRRLMTPRAEDFDTNYITTNKRKLTIAIPISKKFYGFNLNDLSTTKTLKFSPNNYYHLGFNFSNIIVTFGFYPGIKFGAKPNRGKTTSRDVQVTVIGRKVITDINVQNYRGFYLYNSNEYELQGLNPDTFIIRPDIKVFSFGINTMYVFRSRKYSLRGAFSFTDVQRKSAGSFMAGIYHSYVEFRSDDTSLVTFPFRDRFSPVLNTIDKISVTTLGASGGYGYTYVYKKIIYSNCINIGLGAESTVYHTLDDSDHKQSLDPGIHLNAKSTLRYDNLRFFTGILASYDNNYAFSKHDFKTENYIAKVVFFAGYRFNIKQNGRGVLRALKLVDY